MAWSKAKTAAVAAVIIFCAAGGGGLYVYQERHPSPAADLRAALRAKKPPTGNWQYPTVGVMKAIENFGSNRAAAFPILERALSGSDPEVRKQAIAAMGMIVQPAMTRSNLELRLVSQHMDITNLSPNLLAALESPPATNGLPLMRKILFANNEFSWFALSSLHSLLEPADIPALADLLVKNHGDPTPIAISMMTTAEVAQAAMKNRKGNQELQRYVPEAIADIISRNPEMAAPFVSSVEDLLDDENADVRFGAACALVKYKGLKDHQITKELTAGLRSRHDDSRLYAGTEELKQLMAIETLQRLGPAAKPMGPELLNYAKTIQEGFMRELALRAAGNIDASLRDTMPEVDAAVKSDPNLRNAVVAKGK